MSTRRILWGTLLVAMVAGTASAEVYIPEPKPQSEVVADLGLHVIGAGYQHSVAPQIAVAADLDYYAPWTQEGANDHDATSLYGAIVRVRAFYYAGAAPTGWWISPFFQVEVAKGEADQKGLVAAGGISGGYEWLFSKKIALAVGVGVQYHYADPAPSFSGVWPHGDIIIGYAF